MADNQTQQPDIINQLLTGFQSKNTQEQTSAGLQALMSLLQPTPDLQSANAAIGPATDAALQQSGISPKIYDATQQSGPSQESVSQQLQKQVALKSYTKQLQAHADNTPHPILGVLLDNWAANGGGQVPQNSMSTNTDGSQGSITGPEFAADAAQSVGAGPGTVQQAQPPQVKVPTGQPQQQAQAQTQQPQDINAQIDAINKQTALNIAKRNLSISQPTNFWQRFGQNFAKMNGGITQADQLQNMAAGQKIAGQELLQPKDIGELNAGSYKSALEATGTALSATQQKLTALTDLYGKEEQNKGLKAEFLHNESPNQSTLRQAITDTADNMVTHTKNFRTLIANRPIFNSEGLNPQTQDIVNKTQQTKVGKYTLVNKK